MPDDFDPHTDPFYYADDDTLTLVIAYAYFAPERYTFDNADDYNDACSVADQFYYRIDALPDGLNVNNYGG